MAVREIGTDIKLTGEKEFNDGMKSINSNLKTLRSDMAAVSATFEDNANSVEALTEKNKILQDSVDQQRVKVDALRQMYEKVAAASGENSAAADKWKQQLNMATVSLAKEEKALRQNNDALEAAKRAAETAESSVEDLADAADEVARYADKAAEGLDDMADKAEKGESILPKVASGLGSVAAGAAQTTAAVLALGAGLGTAAITTLVSFANESAEAAKAAADAGETLTETQQQWLDYADKLGTLDAASAKAKRALGGILLPQLKSLSQEGADYLNNFAQSMEEAGGDVEKQAEVISEYMAEGAQMLLDNLPAYIQNGKILLSGIKDGFLEAAPEIWETIKAEGTNFVDGLKECGPEAVETIVTGITGALPSLGTAAGQIVGDLAMWLTDPATIQQALDAAWSLGEAVANAIWEALKGIFLGLVNLNELFGPLSGDFGHALSTGKYSPNLAIPGHADGLSRVPYDDYLARLHKDEMVLTAAEADRYRSDRGGLRPVLAPNITIYTQHLTEEEMGRILDTIDRKLGDSL